MTREEWDPGGRVASGRSVGVPTEEPGSGDASVKAVLEEGGRPLVVLKVHETKTVAPRAAPNGFYKRNSSLPSHGVQILALLCTSSWTYGLPFLIQLLYMKNKNTNNDKNKNTKNQSLRVSNPKGDCEHLLTLHECDLWLTMRLYSMQSKKKGVWEVPG